MLFCIKMTRLRKGRFQEKYHLVRSESGAVPTDRSTAERRIMQVSSSVNARYYISYWIEKSVSYGANVSQTEEQAPNGTTENSDVHKARMFQGV